MESSKISARADLGACHRPHLKRLNRILEQHEDHDRLDFSAATTRSLGVGQSVSVIDRPVFLVSGWACRARVLPDGRRQIFSHLLPGDLAHHRGATAGDSGAIITALVPTVVIDAPQEHHGHDAAPLRRAYQSLKNDEDRYLHGQMLRLGRLTAGERLVHLFLEFAERLRVIDVGDDERFPLPVSQEIIADTLGLTTVHINRTLQLLRRDNVVKWEGGYVKLSNPASLATKVYFEPRRAPSGPRHRYEPATDISRHYDIAC